MASELCDLDCEAVGDKRPESLASVGNGVRHTPTSRGCCGIGIGIGRSHVPCHMSHQSWCYWTALTYERVYLGFRHCPRPSLIVGGL